jgi:hypothetical protein
MLLVPANALRLLFRTFKMHQQNEQTITVSLFLAKSLVIIITATRSRRVPQFKAAELSLADEFYKFTYQCICIAATVSLRFCGRDKMLDTISV